MDGDSGYSGPTEAPPKGNHDFHGSGALDGAHLHHLNPTRPLLATLRPPNAPLAPRYTPPDPSLTALAPPPGTPNPVSAAPRCTQYSGHSGLTKAPTEGNRDFRVSGAPDGTHLHHLDPTRCFLLTLRPPNTPLPPRHTPPDPSQTALALPSGTPNPHPGGPPCVYCRMPRQKAPPHGKVHFFARSDLQATKARRI